MEIDSFYLVCDNCGFIISIKKIENIGEWIDFLGGRDFNLFG